MLGIKIDNEFLDLLPGTQLEMEQNNPYLQFSDQIAGEYSLPIEIPATAKNIRLTRYASLMQTRADKISIECEVYSNGFQHSVGKLRIERPNIHLNNAKRGRISAYYLTGISSFYKDIQDVDLRSIDLGGVRSFGNDNFNTAGAGFWGHIHSVINAAPGYGNSGFDYAFYPCFNREHHPSGVTELVNSCELSGGNPVFSQYVQKGGSAVRHINPIIPFPYLKYVLKKAVEHVGWKITGDMLEDENFKKITLWNTRAINWGWRKVTVGGGVSYSFFMRDPISFNLVDFLPNVKISAFLLAIKNKLGLWYDFDRVNKVIYVRRLIDVSANNIKDLSADANPFVQKDVLREKKTYAVKTTDGAAAFDTSKSFYQGDVQLVADLPAAAEALVDQVYLVMAENNYYICQQNETTGDWEWAILVPNIGGVIPANAQEEIVSDAVTAGSEKFDAYRDMLPSRDETGIMSGVWGEDYDFTSIVLLFNHGKQLNAAGQSYPLGSHHIYTSGGLQVGDWSLAYKAKKFDGTEVGLYDVFFKKFIETITAGEEFEITLNLSFAKYLQLKFSDIISINNVRIYILQIKPTLPYNGQVVIKCSRI